MAKRAVVYCRISDDRGGAGLGVARQEKDCRQLCAEQGWEVVAVKVDNDISAYSGKRRPAWQSTIDLMKDGRVDILVAWHPDRLTRRTAELEQLITLVEATSVDIATVTAGAYDLSTPAGRMTARVVGATAAYESEHKAERIRRKHAELAELGKVSGGGSRPFGFHDDRVTPKDDEVRLIREAARRVLDGETVRSVCADWNAHDVKTVSGKLWSQAVLRRLLVAPRTAGLRVAGEWMVKAQWPAILDEVTHARLRRLLLDPARTTNGGLSRRSYLLVRFMVCGLCGSNLVARPRGDKRRCYVCASGPGFGGCGKIRRLAEPVEQLVLDEISVRLAAGKLARVVEERGSVDRDELLASIRDDEASLERLATDHYVDRTISRPEYLAARKALDARLAALRGDLAEDAGTAPVARYAAKEGLLVAEWESLTLDQQRIIVGALVEKVVAHPARKGYNRFDASRIQIVWR